MEHFEEDTSLYGTRANGTESLVYRILQTPAYRTVPIIARFLEAALVGIKPKPTELARRAKNIVDRIVKYGERAIPKNEFDLASWSDVSVSNIGNGLETTVTTRTCLGCSRKFIASRKQENRVFHSDECHAMHTEKLMQSDIMPAGWKACAVCCGPFLPEYGTEKYCKRKACNRASERQNARLANSRVSEPA
jgi:hypothetical protein